MMHDFKNFPELTDAQLQEMPFDSPHEQIKNDFDAVVERVTDGDTVRLRASFRDFDFPLRFLNIDAPEMNAGGDVTKQWLRTKVEGKKVRVLIDPKNRVDKYGRLLGRVVYAGLDVGEEEIYLGLAKRFTERYLGSFPNLNKEFKLKKWF